MTAVVADPIVEALRAVADPCSLAMGAPIDVWSLGLVEDVVVDDGHARVDLLLTDISCGYFRDMRRHIIDALLEVPGVESVEVKLVTSMLWTPDRMRTVSGPRPPDADMGD